MNSSNVKTYVLKQNEDLMGYFEQIFYKDKLECEIAYFGILEEYIGKKFGGHLLSEAIKKIFLYWIQKSLGAHMFFGSQTCIKKLFI